MKKKLFFLAVAAVALASCSNDETIASQANSEANEISFRPIISGVTRAANDYGVKSTWETNDILYVNAIRTVSDNKSLLFQDQFVKNANGFYSTTKYYWPTDLATNSIYFTAFWGVPYKDISSYSNGDEFLLNTSYTVGNVGAQTDILYAQSPAYSSKPNANGSIVLNFRHMLSQIVVQVANTEANLDIDISGVMIGNVQNTGSFNYTGTETSTAATTGGANVIPYASWTPSGASTNNYAQTTGTNPAITQKSLTSTQNADGITGYTPLILMPQNTSAATAYNAQENTPNNPTSINQSTEPAVNGSYIALKMVIKDHTTQTTIVSERWCVWPITANWSPGYKYIYTVNAGSGGYQPIDQDGTTALDPVLGNSVIWFSPSCTIDVWATGGGNVSAP